MSTLAYASLTSRREAAPPGTSTDAAPPGVRSYVDALAALVPAEVLTLHAVILSVTTSTVAEPERSVTITNADTLAWAFFGLIALGIVLYIVPRFRTWDRLDYLRVCIPPLAFVAWTMLQRATAFDAVAPGMEDAERTVVALFIAVVLGIAATVLARKADQKERVVRANPHHRTGGAMGLDRQAVTARTICGVSEWSGAPTKEITVAALLVDLRDNARTQLRSHNNDQFVGQTGFPVPPDDWEAKQSQIMTVGELRDFNLERNTDASTV